MGLFVRLLPDPKLRLRVALAFLVIALLLIYFPFLITPAEGEKGRGGGRGVGRQRSQVSALEQRLAEARTGSDKAYLDSVGAKLADPLDSAIKGKRSEHVAGRLSSRPDRLP